MAERFGFFSEGLNYEQTRKLPLVSELILSYLREHPGMDEKGKGRVILKG